MEKDTVDPTSVTVAFKVSWRAYETLRQHAKLFQMPPNTYARAELLARLGLWDEILDKRKISRKEKGEG